jgi:hypothetical protein
VRVALWMEAVHSLQSPTNKEIAAAPGQSERAVKNQVRTRLARTGRPTRARLSAPLHDYPRRHLPPAPGMGFHLLSENARGWSGAMAGGTGRRLFGNGGSGARPMAACGSIHFGLMISVYLAKAGGPTRGRLIALLRQMRFGPARISSIPTTP